VVYYYFSSFILTFVKYCKSAVPILYQEIYTFMQTSA